ncbi:MAG: alpha/beta fold hydrolase [Promethearchaeota archaeon]
MELKEQFSQTIKLKDGRLLGYGEFGDPKGEPIFHFHGFPGSRLEGLFADEVCKRAGVRFIGIDRPGMGLSTFKKNRTILDWPDDVVELANALGFDKFSVEGVSGGGPYAAACAYKIPAQLKACGIIGGLGPATLSKEGMQKSGRILFSIARTMPWLLQFFLWASIGRKSKSLEATKEMIKKSSKNLPEPDKKLIEDPIVVMYFAKGTQEAFRQGSKGPAHDAKLYAKDWGFKLQDISPNVKVYLWHGELDIDVPISMGRAMAEAIPNCEATYFPNDAHISTAINHFDEIIKKFKTN